MPCVAPRVEEAEEARAAVRLDPDRREPGDRARSCRRRRGSRRARPRRRASRRASASARSSCRGRARTGSAPRRASPASRSAARARRVSAAALPGEIHSGPDEQRQLRELGGLERGRPEVEPALGAVDLRRDDEHGGAEAERGQDERRRELRSRRWSKRDATSISATPAPHRSPCRFRNVIGSPFPIAAAPTWRCRPSPARRRRGPASRARARAARAGLASPTFTLEVLYQPPELLSAVLEIPELVVARARRREQHDLARLAASPPPRPPAPASSRGGTARSRSRDRPRALRRPRRSGTPSTTFARATSCANSSKRSPLSEPPRIRWSGASKAVSARRAAAVFVAFESLT